ncbi:MAG: indolepyruvate ferredoxin oxidoreductase family protein [Dehalococcoidia bacterium]|nr:indolepyruvate ferredoxin oxidoreductase family protein [Dehalococcoidia bacterium]
MTTVPLVNKETPFSLDLKFTREEGMIYLSGIHALARLPMDHNRADKRRGLNTATFMSGYPGSPLGGLDLEVKRREKLMKEHNVHFTPGLNEDLAATAILGSQLMHRYAGPKYDGVVGVWFGKSPGVDRSGDALRHGNMMGVGKNGGVLLYAGDDPTAKSSTLPSDSTQTIISAGMPLLLPGNVQDILDLGLHGFMLSRTSGLWVVMRIVTNLADGSGTALVAPDRINPTIPEMEIDGQPFEPKLNIDYVATPMMVEVEHLLYHHRTEIALRYARENGLNRIVVPTKDAWLGIVASGKTYFDTRQALEELGLDEAALDLYGIRLLKPGMIYPLEPQIVREFALGLQEILVIEEKRPVLETAIKDIMYSLANRPVVVGKFDEEETALLPNYGELDSDTIARAIARRVERKTTLPSVRARVDYLDLMEHRKPPPGTQRIPYFCSGCPHNRSIRLPEGSTVGAGIGCHTLIVFVDPKIAGTHVGLMHMGAEGAQWIGLAPFTQTPHMFQNIGDGTLFHSGTLAIRYAVASGVSMTYKILYNHVVAMTGGQEATGVLSVPDLTRLLETEGVKKIIVTTDNTATYKGVHLAKIAEVWHRDRLIEAQSVLATHQGVTVLIHDQHCALEKRRRRKRGLMPDPPERVYIHNRVCEGCGDCARKSDCLSVHPVDSEFGPKMRIHQSSCNKDYSCLLGDCPSLLTVSPDKRQVARRPHHDPPQIDLPEPVMQVPTDKFELYMTGIGGTGVVTTNQILGTAALLDGKHIHALDQTGLAQKGGPVVSHLKFSTSEMNVSNNVSVGSADLYLAFDLLVATQPNNLAKTDPVRTVAVVSTSEIPSGRMVVNNTVHFPDKDIKLDEIRNATRQGQEFCLDAEEIAEAFFDDYMAANNICLGAAYQLGALPISIGAIEQAVRLNGVEIDMNLAAFRWGRLAVAFPKLLEAEMKKVTGKPALPQALSANERQLIESAGTTGEARRVLESRVPELVRYQDLAYASQYVDFVRKVRQVEEMKCPGRLQITEAVARYLFKLMAYKDEYEVARLLLDPSFRAELKEKFGDNARVQWHLQPPILSFAGPRSKLALGSWFAPAFKVLKAMRRFRGTALDIFGRSETRRLERSIIAEYKNIVEKALTKLGEQNYDTALAIALAPDMIRGYERLKMASVGPFREKVNQLLAQL